MGVLHLYVYYIAPDNKWKICFVIRMFITPDEGSIHWIKRLTLVRPDVGCVHQSKESGNLPVVRIRHTSGHLLGSWCHSLKQNSQLYHTHIWRLYSSEFRSASSKTDIRTNTATCLLSPVMLFHDSFKGKLTKYANNSVFLTLFSTIKFWNWHVCW